MAEITADAVKELRDRSGACMMDCKKALTEANGDLEAATDWLRAKGLAAAQKKSSRTAAEGLVGVAVAGRAALRRHGRRPRSSPGHPRACQRAFDPARRGHARADDDGALPVLLVSQSA